MFKIILISDSFSFNKSIKNIVYSFKYKIYELNYDDNALIHKLQMIKPDFIILKKDFNENEISSLYVNIITHVNIHPEKIIFIYKKNLNILDFPGDAIFFKIPFNSNDLIKILFNKKPNKTILFIDDTQLYHTMFVPELKKIGYNVLQSFNSEEAYKLAFYKNVDLIILDIEMPNINGYDLCKKFKSNNYTQNIPVILFSLFSSDTALEYGFHSGADDYVIKNITKSNLIAKVEKYLNTNSIIRNENILIVEDSITVRNIISQSLTNHGFYLIDEAESGYEALKFLKLKKYQLIITDYEMPEMNGYELCYKIKSNNNYNDIPIIILSKNNQEVNIFKFEALGIYTFITKPFDSYRLLAEIEKLLVEHKQKKEMEHVKTYLSSYTMEAIEHYSDDNLNDVYAIYKYLTIMFLDIVNFTTYSEKYSPKVVINSLNDIFSNFVPIIIKHNGVIDKFIGDAILTIFDNKEKGAINAVNTAISLINELNTYNTSNKNNFHIRIGIHYGKVIIGDIGNKNYRREYTIIGDNVNIAQRIENIAQNNSICISQVVNDFVKTHFNTVHYKNIILKGKTKEMNIFKVLY